MAGLCACQDMVQRLFSEAIFRPSQLTTMLNFGWLRAIVSSLCLLYYMVSICKCIYIYIWLHGCVNKRLRIMIGEGNVKNSRSQKMKSQMFRGSHAIPLLLKCFHEMDIYTNKHKNQARLFSTITGSHIWTTRAS